MGWVYAIRCTPTDEFYIGSTTGPYTDRFKSHLKNLKVGRRTPPKLQEAYDTYGREALNFIPIKEFPNAELAEREREALEKVKPALNVARRRPADQRTNSVAENAYARLHYRRRLGLTGDALAAPPHANKKRYEVRGEMLTANEIAEKYGLPLATVRTRASSRLPGEAIIRGATKSPVN